MHLMVLKVTNTEGHTEGHIEGHIEEVAFGLCKITLNIPKDLFMQNIDSQLTDFTTLAILYHSN